MIQGKEALIALNDTDYEIYAVPEIARERNIIRDTSYFRLEDGFITGNGQLSLSGYAKVFNTYRLNRTTEKDVKDYVTRLLSRGSNKFYVEQYKIENLQDLDKPVRIDYNFRVADYYKKIGDEIYFNMNMDKSYYREYIKKDRKLPLENEFKYTQQTVAALELPAGYQVKHLPADDTFNGKNLGYSIRYQQKGGKIIQTRELYMNFLLLQPDQFAEWNEVIKKLSEAYSETIILKRNPM